jgi:hypothetical protein
MIDRSQPEPPDLVDIVEPVDLGHESRAVAEDLARPVLFRPTGHIRSPIVERRSDPPPDRGDRPGVEMPPLRSFVGPLVWVIVPALPVMSRVGWQAAFVVGVVAIIVREARLRVSRSTISFGDGFLAYAGENRWPQGVQEDDDVHWNWSTFRHARPGQNAGG